MDNYGVNQKKLLERWKLTNTKGEKLINNWIYYNIIKNKFVKPKGDRVQSGTSSTNKPKWIIMESMKKH